MKGVKEFEIDIDGIFLIKTDNTLKFEESVIKNCYSITDLITTA